MQFGPVLKADTNPAVELRDVEIADGDVVLRHIDLTIPVGSRFAIYGPPRSGTMLARALLGKASIAAGSGHVCGVPLPDLLTATSTLIGGLLHDFDLPSRQTVRQAMTRAARSVRRARSGVDSVIEQVGLTARAHEVHQALSHKERQLAGLATLILHDVKLVVLDDFVAGLSDFEGREIMEIAKGVCEGRTVIFTTSNADDVRLYATHVAEVRGETIVQFPGTISEFLPSGTMCRIVFQGDVGRALAHVQSLAWIKAVEVRSSGRGTEWIVTFDGTAERPTALLRAILADRHLVLKHFEEMPAEYSV